MKRGRMTGLTMALSLVFATVAALVIPGAANAAAVTVCGPWQSFIHGPNGVGSARVCITRESIVPNNGYLRGVVYISNQSNIAMYVTQQTVAVNPQTNPPVSAGQKFVSPGATDVVVTPWYKDITVQPDYAVAQVTYWRADLMKYASLTLVTPYLI